MLAAHGTLLKPSKPIETGLLATELLRCRIEQRLSSCFGIVVNGWLNHTRGGQWTDPPIEEALKRVSDAGFRDVVYYPYGFLADNAESQLEGQLAAAGAARAEGAFRAVPQRLAGSCAGDCVPGARRALADRAAQSRNSVRIASSSRSSDGLKPRSRGALPLT